MTAIPEILIRRNLPEEYHFGTQGGRRYVDDEEIIIISLLDERGILSETRKLNDFMIVLTRLEKKVDHRAIALEILTNYLAPAQAKEFVMFGGFRLLRRWLREAEEEDSLFEMLAIIKLAAKLPFDSNSIKVSEIGKLIKRLQKYQPKHANHYTTIEVNEFLQAVNQVVDSWKEQLQMISKTKKAQAEAPITSAVVKIEPKTETKDVPTKKALESKPLVSSINQNLPVRTPVTVTMASTETKMDVVEESEDPLSLASPAASTPTTTFSFPPETNDESIESKNSEPVVPLPSVMSTLPAAKPVVKERKPLGMLEGARKLLAMRSEQAKTAAATAATTAAANSSDLQKDIVSNDVKDPAARNQKPLAKGGLKKKDSSSTKKEKVGIKWADEEGGLLREIYTIEVEKIKSSVANYKTHKDLVKKERQLEKETHLTQVTEAMHRTTEWRIPKPLSLSIQITDNIGIPTGSIEKNVQAERIASVLEVRYLDESLIPNDPDEDQHMLDNNEIIKFSTLTNNPEALANVGIESIPWKIDGQEEEEVLPVMNTVSSSSAGTMMPGAGTSLPYGMMNNAAAPYSSMNSPYGYVNNYNGSTGSNVPYNEFDINTFANSLPEKLQALDPFTFQFLIQDQSILSYLILPDGQTVNDPVLNVLKNSHSLEDFYNGLKLLSSSSLNTGNTTGRSRVSRWQQAGNTTPGMTSEHSWMDSTGTGRVGGFSNGPTATTSSSGWGPTTNTIVSTPFISHSTHLLDPVGMNNPNMNMGQWMMPDSEHHMMPTSSLNISSMSVNAAASASTHRTSSKSEIPCRFFNSPKGCMNGDKCKFGHFIDPAKGSSHHGGGIGEAGKMGPGMKHGPGAGRLAGPGSRHSSGPGAASLSASILSTVMDSSSSGSKGKVGRPSKRAKH